MKTYLEYKGYIGTVALSVEDRCFFGKIQGINDLITFEGDSVDALEAAFREAVDDYLSFCEECHIEPDKAYKGQFNVRVSPELHKKIATEAIKNDISLNQMVEKAISSYIDYQKRPSVNVFAISTQQADEFYKHVNKSGWREGRGNRHRNSTLRLVQGGMQ